MAPQFVVSSVIRRAAELDPLATERFLGEQNLSIFGWSGALTSYVDGLVGSAGGQVDWPSIATRFESVSEDVGSYASSPARDVLVTRWASEDVGGAMEWYLGQNQENTSGQETRTGELLARVNETARGAVVDWIGGQQSQGRDSGEIASAYLRRITPIATHLGPEVEQAMSFIENESTRYDLISGMMNRNVARPQANRAGSDAIFRYTANELSSLIQQANLTGEHQTHLLQRIESGN
jgi:hypothetical protein